MVATDLAQHHRTARLCIIGANGMLGRELVRLAAERPNQVSVRACDRDEVDITNAKATTELLGEMGPALVINAAAYTDVDGCESHSDDAWAVNVEGPANLARACLATGSRLVHVSTDFVFDGQKSTPYVPSDAMNPLCVYGATKAAGEQRVREILQDHAIIRTSWLFGVEGKNFVKTIRRLAQERDELSVVDDQVGCPTYAPDLATALLTVARGSRVGTYHFCNAGACSWHTFACEIVSRSGRSTPVKPINSTQLQRPARRPAYSVLDTTRFTRDTGIVPRAWQESLKECLTALGPLDSSRARESSGSAAVERG